MSKNRLGIAFFYDEHGVVDDYYLHLIESLSKFTTRNILVSNGKIGREFETKIRNIGFEIIVRENIGFDVWAYKSAIEFVGYDDLASFDEILLYNHTFYGPIYPFDEMFDEMDGRDCDFWGITSHKAMNPNPFTGKGVLPRHLNSHFIAVRTRMVASSAFQDYWLQMPMITSYNDSILTHESRFTEHFQNLGFRLSVYIDDINYSSDYPAQTNVDEVLENRCPILKRRIFFHDPIMHESNAIDLPRALRIMRATSSYDEKYIWPNILRTADLRTLNTTSALTSVLPDTRLKHIERVSIRRIAVCAHVYYVDMLDEILELCKNIPNTFDFIATTDTEEKASAIRSRCAGVEFIDRTIVRILEVNRGRDMSALFITCRDLFLEDNYDLVCRLHSKKSPQVESSRSNTFKRHMFENLLNSVGYVENILDLFEEKPWVGLAIPPAVHISYSTLGHGWFNNKPKATEEASKLGIKTKFDNHTPVAAYGTMFWFRPKALHVLFEREWHWDEFNAEPNHVDGGLAHVLERLITYAAQNSGYTTEQVITRIHAAFNYAMLEFKYSELSSNVGYAFHEQVWMMRQWKMSGNILPNISSQSQPRPEFAFRAAWYEDKNLLLPRDEMSAENIATALDRSLNPGQIISLQAGHTRLLLETAKNFDEDFNIIKEYLSKFDKVSLLTESDNLDLLIEQYLTFGWMSGQDIFTLFDTAFYLKKYHDVAMSGMNPFVHYILYGAKERRQPHPLFDTTFYLKKIGALTSETDPVALFIFNGPNDYVSPCPLFDIGLYYYWNQDVFEEKPNALCHYIKYGAAERRKFHILFDIDYYESGIGKQLNTKVNALTHFLLIGAELGISPHILFDMEFYTQQVGNDLRLADSLNHFLSSSPHELKNPHPLFDVKFYQKHADPIDLETNPLEAFCKAAGSDMSPAHELFDAQKYLTMYPAVARAGINPLLHYVKHGVFEQAEIPGFDKKVYVEENNLKNSDIYSHFVHSLKYKTYKLS